MPQRVPVLEYSSHCQISRGVSSYRLAAGLRGLSDTCTLQTKGIGCVNAYTSQCTQLRRFTGEDDQLVGAGPPGHRSRFLSHAVDKYFHLLSDQFAVFGQTDAVLQLYEAVDALSFGLLRDLSWQPRRRVPFLGE